MKIKIGYRQSTIGVDVISILLIILFFYNVCWLKTSYYFESPTIWNNLYGRCQTLLFIYLSTLVLINLSHNILKCKICKINLSCIIIFFLLFYQLAVTYYNNFFSKGIVCQIVIWPLCFLVGSIYFDKSALNTRNIIIINASIVVYGLMAIESIVSHLLGRGNIGGVIFPVYALIAMCSFLLIQKNSIFKSMLITYIAILIISTTKRTGILCICIGLFMYYFLQTIWNEKSLVTYFKTILKIILAVLVIFMLIKYLEIDVLDRFYALSQDGGSGRNEIWQGVYQGFQNSDIYKKTFGYGFNAVGKILKPQGREILAHNDYLEYLYDFGLIGLCLILSFLLANLNRLYKFIKSRNNLAPAFAYVMCCFLLLSMFSYLMCQSILINMFVLFLGMSNNIQWKDTEYDL